MSAPRYLWRRLTPKQREELLAWRIGRHYPWHAPPHRPNFGHRHFLVSAACYEHTPHIGFSPQRMDDFTAALQAVLSNYATEIVAWCVLPNHYHCLVDTPNILRLLFELGRLHGRMSHAWNGEENTRGRHVFHRATERFMRTERHYFATINYIHNNPVHHRYVRLWTEWPWSSASAYLKAVGRAKAKHAWEAYPLRDYGKTWDPAEL